MDKNIIEPRLVALYNEYLEKGKEEEFLWMLYLLLDHATQTVREKVRRTYATWKRKFNAPKLKSIKDKLEAFFASMSVEELIKFQNTPWEELPEWIREAMPKIVKRPEKCNSVRLYGLVNKEERQKEIVASRLTRYMEKHGFITTYEGRTTLHYENFAKVCNELAKEYDLPATLVSKQQKVRVTARDLQNCTEFRVTPKGDKLAVLACATGLPVWYLSGYRDGGEPNSKDKDPLGAAPFTARYKKARRKTTSKSA